MPLLTLPAVVQAQTITDNFTDPTNWGTPLAAPGKAMSIGSGRMNYTSTSTDVGGAAIPRNGPLLPTTQDWSIKVDAHIDPLTLTTLGQFTDVFLGFGKTGDWFNTHVTFEFDRGWWNSSYGYDIGDDVRIDGVYAPGLFDGNNLTSPNVALRMDYSAGSHTITYYFDGDGAANGYTWVAQGTANLANGTYNLNLSATDTFTIFLLGSSEYQTVTDGQAYLSSLEITVKQPPAVATDPGVRTNRFGFTIFGSTNQVVVVVASTNLVGGTWVPLQTNTLASASFYFSDPDWTNYRGRFYRLRSP